MNIVQFFFGIFKECFNTINVDFFGLGFTWLEFLLASSLILIIFKFLFGIVGVSDSIDTSSVLGGLAHQNKMKNEEREKQLKSSHENKKIDGKELFW